MIAAGTTNPSPAWHELGPCNVFNATLARATFAEVLESRGEHPQCGVSPGDTSHGDHPTNHTAGLRNSDSCEGYTDILALTRLSSCAIHSSQGCSPVSSCMLSMFGLEWITSREKAVLEEVGLVIQWVAFFPLSQY